MIKCPKCGKEFNPITWRKEWTERRHCCVCEVASWSKEKRGALSKICTGALTGNKSRLDAGVAEYFKEQQPPRSGQDAEGER